MTLTPGKLGALPPVRPFGLAELSAYAAAPLPPPPSSVVIPDAQWHMFANGPDPACDVPGAPFGDCTIAGAANALSAFNAVVGEHDPVPSSDEVANQYLALTGGEDKGCVEAKVLHQWQQKGLFGGTIAAYAPVNYRKLIDIHQAIAAYGAVYLGVALPESAQEQFANEQPWTVVPDSPIEGGHCVLGVSYDPKYMQVVTWASVQDVSLLWLSAYVTEAWAIIPNQFVEAGKGPEVNLAALKADLGRLK